MVSGSFIPARAHPVRGSRSRARSEISAESVFNARGVFDAHGDVRLYSLFQDSVSTPLGVIETTYRS